VIENLEIDRINANVYPNAETKTKTKTESVSESETVRQASQPDCASSIALFDGSAIASYADITSDLRLIV
jgi:hypothetical protein